MRIIPSITTAALLFAASMSFADDAYSVTHTYKLGGPGRWDYLFADPSDHLLYVTRSTHTQVIDSATGKVVADIEGGGGIHGTAIAPKANRGFITDGKAGELIAFDLKTRTVLGKIAAADDADGIIYDAGSDRVLASCGDAGQLAVLDPNADITTAKVQTIDLGGKPEFLTADGQGKAFVCLNDKNQVAAVDLKTMKVLDRWACGTGTSPTGISIDAKNGRLFVGCRNQKLIVMNTADGKVLAELPIGRGNDACAFDAGTGEAFASCGDGTVTIVKETTPGKFEVTQTLTTRQGARTMTIDPLTHTLYLPTAEFEPMATGQKGRPTMKPDTFSIIVAERGSAK